MPRQTTNVFVSYSHADASLVGPVVQLLRVNKSLVFQDTDGIQPGKKWRGEIAKALAESHLVVVFWCDHACRSTEVATEWKGAVEQEKDVLPLLLDATPLPSELGQFQWIDFRGTVGASHSSIDSPAYDAPIPASRPQTTYSESPRRAVWYTLAGAAAIMAVVLFSTLSSSPPVPLPPKASDSVLISWDLVLLGVVAAVGAYLLWLRRRGKRTEKRIKIARPQPDENQIRIAVEIEAEIRRRTASAQKGET